MLQQPFAAVRPSASLRGRVVISLFCILFTIIIIVVMYSCALVGGETGFGRDKELQESLRNDPHAPDGTFTRTTQTPSKPPKIGPRTLDPFRDSCMGVTPPSFHRHDELGMGKPQINQN